MDYEEQDKVAGKRGFQEECRVPSPSSSWRRMCRFAFKMSIPWEAAVERGWSGLFVWSQVSLERGF